MIGYGHVFLFCYNRKQNKITTTTTTTKRFHSENQTTPHPNQAKPTPNQPSHSSCLESNNVVYTQSRFHYESQTKPPPNQAKPTSNQPSFRVPFLISSTMILNAKCDLRHPNHKHSKPTQTNPNQPPNQPPRSLNVMYAVYLLMQSGPPTLLYIILTKEWTPHGGYVFLVL